MNSIVDVTVIMAVYNSAQYLESAVNSVLDERESNIELFLVDDGSTDGSSEICDAIAQRDSRVKVIHKSNGGMCQARNVALACARGEYVTFVDNDDRVLKGFVDANLAVARKYDADVVRFGRVLQRIDSTGRVLRSTEACPDRECCLEGSKIRSELKLAYCASDGVWTGLYRVGMLRQNRIVFPESFRSGMEDVWFNDQVVKVAGNYAFNDHSYYVWQRRAGHSTSMTPSVNRFDSIQRVLSLEYEMMSEYGTFATAPDWCSRRLFAHVRDCLTTVAYQDSEDRNSYKSVCEQVRKLLNPYVDFLRSCKPGGVDGLLFTLLDSKRYGLLRQVVFAGVGVKRLMKK